MIMNFLLLIIETNSNTIKVTNIYLLLLSIVQYLNNTTKLVNTHLKLLSTGTSTDLRLSVNYSLLLLNSSYSKVLKALKDLKF